MKQAGSWLFVGLLVLLVACGKAPTEPAMVEGQAVDGGLGSIDLDQGWSHADQDGASFASFGSRLLPADWMRHLERAGSTERFVADAHMDALGFIVQSPGPSNPDGYPVGFTREYDSEGQEWVGLGCAACHTGQVDYRGTRMRIDGGQALIDFDAFEGELVESLSATAERGPKFERFADAIVVAKEARPALREALVVRAQTLDARHRMNQSPVPYGPGRLDAFGQIFNAVAVTFLGIADNQRVPDAPVSYPVMWDASHLDLVQWNGSAPNAGPGPLLQNVTTALAVYGALDINHDDALPGYSSDIDFEKLGQIQDWFYQLRSPQWPTHVLGELDGQRVARGQTLYAGECQSCHVLSDRDDPRRELKAVLTPLDEIGTDPKMARNFLDADAETGPWKGEKVAFVAGDVLGERAPTIDLVAHAAIGATLRHPVEGVRDAVASMHHVYKAGLSKDPDYYKARPLSGIWASAPYLHNGSVPSLVELLKPPTERLASFHVGSREFDPENVGLETGEGPHSSLFDTSLPGNGNGGHDYGTALSAEDKRDLLEYLKSL